MLTKKNNYNIILKKKTKQQLIFLRAPKHFNIGKQKVKNLNFIAFNYLKNINFDNKIINTRLIINNNFLNIISCYYKLNELNVINTLHINIYTKIKF